MDALGAIIVLLPTSLVIEGGAIMHHINTNGAELRLALIAGSTMAAIYNLNVFALVQATDSVSYTVVAGSAKVLLIGGAAILIDHITAPLKLTGTVLFLIGFVVFVAVKINEEITCRKEAAAAAAQAAAPSENTP